MKNNKRIILFVLFVCILGTKSFAYDAYIDGIWYNLIGDEAQVTYSFSYTETDRTDYTGNIVIPESVTYDGKSYIVTSIGNNAFSSCIGLISIMIPNTVSSIGYRAFSGCYNLASINIPASVYSIGSYAFQNTKWYESHADGVVYAGKVAYKYKGTMSAGTSIVLEEGTVGIADAAFKSYYTFDHKYGSDYNESCVNMSSITLPNSVISIGEYAFAGCTGLTSITIPNSVTFVGDYAFSGCSNLYSIDIPTSLYHIGGYAFNNTKWYESQVDGVIYAGKVAYRYKGTMPAGTSIELKEGTVGIVDYAFYDCDGLISIFIPNSVMVIGDHTFQRCNLSSITIPNSVVSIGNYAFCDCHELSSILLQNGVTSIGENAFAGCPITSIDIPESVTSIGNYTFSYCSNLTSLTIPNGVVSIGDGAFENCKKLNSLKLGDGVTTIGKEAFKSCGIMSLTLGYKVEDIGTDAFKDCTYLNSITFNCETVKSWFSRMSSIKEINCSDRVTTIGASAFSNCTGLASVTLSNGITTIGENTFNSCTSLKSVTFPNSVTAIGASAFQGCTGLKSVTLPNSVTSIGERTFSGCTGLESVTLSNSVTTIGESAFYGCSSLVKITIPHSIKDIASGIFSSCSSLKEIVIPNSVQTIGDGAFSGCNSLESISFPASVTTLGMQAFGWCNNLAAVTLPSSIKTIGWCPFSGCDKLSKITSMIENPSELTSTGGENRRFIDMFEVKVLQNAIIYVPIGTKSKYEEQGFNNVVEIERILSDGEVFIEKTDDNVDMIFKVIDNTNWLCQVGEGNGKSALPSTAEHATIPQTVRGCTVTRIADGALSGCSSLLSISFPETITSLDSPLLQDCNDLAAIQWNANAILPIEVLSPVKENPNLLLYVKEKTYAPSGVENVVVDGKAEKIVLHEAGDGNNFYCPKTFNAQKVEFVHHYSMKSGYNTCEGWETIVLPFDVTRIENESSAELVSIKDWKQGDSQRPFWLFEQTDEGWASVSNIKANVPYIICMPNNAENYEDFYNITGNVTFKGTNVQVISSEKLSSSVYLQRHFIPNYQNKDANNNTYALNVNNQWDKYPYTTYLQGSTFIRSLRPVRPFEAYMTVEGSSSPRAIPINETPTGIFEMEDGRAKTDDAVWYTLDGRKLQGKPTAKGLYIINGRKVVVK